MAIYRLHRDLWFPDVEEFSDDIIAVGGDLNISRLLLAYQRGIFPWYNEGDEIIWWCPHERCVLFHDELKVSKSMRNILNRHIFRCTLDQQFDKVIRACRETKRGDQGTWVSDDIIKAYSRLHKMGYAHSVEVWQGDALVGGLYGVSLGTMFFGESMFSQVSNASKAGLIFLIEKLNRFGFKAMDCQVYNPHLGSLGACTIPREDFLAMLHRELQQPTRRGDWGEVLR